ncbi:MAG: hypothetical protein IJ840_04495 [Bacteroidales bacterium]|nr:hypothetical protein [Bacteroidales bacterium]
MRRLRFLPALLLLVLSVDAAAQRSQGLVPDVNEKSWGQLLMEDNYTWRPPQSVNMLVEPAFSPDQIFVNPSLVVYRGRIPEGVSSQDSTRVMAETQQDLTVQFALGDPAFVPDYKQTGLRLEQDKYPVVHATYFADNVEYKFVYSSIHLAGNQTLLDIHIDVTNKEEYAQSATIWTKIGFAPEDKMFAYHYLPYEWDASYWTNTEGVTLSGDKLLSGDSAIGRIDHEGIQMDWVDQVSFSDDLFDRKRRYMFSRSGYATRPYRLHELKDVIRLARQLEPEESCSLDIKLLMDEKNVRPSDETALAELTYPEIKEKAVTGYTSLFSDKDLDILFPTMRWGDITTFLQLNIMQMLYRYPGRQWLQTGQGGSSERFYVWVFEAVQMLRPMLKTGHLGIVRQTLDYIFSLQDSGFPPEGDFTTLEGAVGTTGPRWANTTGMALDLASEYYLYSNDQEFLDDFLPKILKALKWISGEVKATRKLNPDGSRPMTYGLMPFAVGGDGEKGYFVGTTDLFTFLGFYKAVDLLERINHPDAAMFRSELELYRDAIHEAIKILTLPDGQISRVLRPDGTKGIIARINQYVDTMAPIATMGLVDPESALFQDFIRFYELNAGDDFFMGKLDQERYYVVQGENYWHQIYLELGEWKKAWGVARAAMKYGMTQDTHLVQERFSIQDPSFCPWQPNGSGSGGVINMITNSLCYESERLEEFILLGAIPYEYLKANGITRVRNLYTTKGVFDMEINWNGSYLEFKLTGHDSLPSKMRIPEYFHPKAVTKGLKETGEGMFELRKDLKEVIFRLYE